MIRRLFILPRLRAAREAAQARLRDAERRRDTRAIHAAQRALRAATNAVMAAEQGRRA